MRQRRRIIAQILAAVSLQLGWAVASVEAAGPVHHFQWEPIPAQQWMDCGFAVAITARDEAGNLVEQFSGTVNLTASFSKGPVTNSILGDIRHSDNFDYGAFTLGYAFTPGTDLIVTHVRHYSGSKVSIWTDAGQLLTSRAVTSIPGQWTETPLGAPLPLMAGTRYRIGFFVTGSDYYWGNDGPFEFDHGTIDGSYEGVGDAFPASSDSVQWWLVDFRYVVSEHTPIPVMPAVSGNFVNGLWAGRISIPASAGRVVLRADDGSAHQGESNPLDLLSPQQRQLDIRLQAGRMVISWPAEAEGFRLEMADTLTPPMVWHAVTTMPALVGARLMVTNDPGGFCRFYRLRREE